MNTIFRGLKGCVLDLYDDELSENGKVEEDGKDYNNLKQPLT